MTVTPTGGENLPANTSDLDTGLEDFGVEDAVVPRLSIVHKEGEFKDSLSNQTFGTIKVIFLGLVKQRVLWHFKVDDGDQPMCKSTDHTHGFPNMDDDVKKEKRFPWDKSNFDPKDFPPDEEFDRIILACDGCELKEWGSHPDGNKPYCSEQFTMPVLYDPFDNGSWVPAIISFQKTGIKPLRSYLTAFQRSGTAAYEAVTEITLRQEQKGSNTYSVPIFKRVGETETTEWRGYSQNFRMMKSFLQAFPGSRDESEPTAPPAPPDNTARAPEAAPAEVKTEEPKTEAPKAQVASGDDDDLPF